MRFIYDVSWFDNEMEYMLIWYFYSLFWMCYLLVIFGFGIFFEWVIECIVVFEFVEGERIGI